jgi:hypothetical protein
LQQGPRKEQRNQTVLPLMVMNAQSSAVRERSIIDEVENRIAEDLVSDSKRSGQTPGTE